MVAKHPAAALADTIAKPPLSRLSGTAIWRVPTLGNEERQALEDACVNTIDVRPGYSLLLECDQPSAIHLLLDGWACRYRMTTAGARQICAVLTPGDACNLDSFISDRLQSHVVTLTACRVAIIPLATARRLCVRYPALGGVICWLMAVESWIQNERLLSIGRRSALERLAHLLCELFLRLSVTGRVENNGFDLPLTQEQLGDVLGLTSVHINRMLQILRNERLVKPGRGRVTVLDWEGLSSVAGFHPDYLRLGQGPKFPCH